jgi:hypothetical protein
MYRACRELMAPMRKADRIRIAIPVAFVQTNAADLVLSISSEVDGHGN